MDNIHIAMKWGAFDFVTKSVHFADRELTISETLEHIRRMEEALNGTAW